ncbi:hypothetical protein [Micromonospora sp. DT41]|uniref:hypothetical protein n=1 Tax=Micromonospora sp. DT41 TaxID=3393437 RepID=UPI003CF98E8D
MNPVPVTRLRLKFYAFAALATVGVVLNAPAWSIAASAFLCAAVPLAMAIQCPGRARALFLPDRAADAAAPTRKVVEHAESR